LFVLNKCSLPLPRALSGSVLTICCKRRGLTFALLPQLGPITIEHFTAAFDHIRPSVAESDLDLYIEWNKKFGSDSR